MINYKNIPLLFMICLASFVLQAQTAKYAGSMKNLVGKKYTDSNNIPGLTGWKFREGSLATAIDDPESMMVDVYQKGTTYIIFFSVQQDTSVKEYVIADLIELKNVTKSQQIKTVLCREYKQENAFIVALTTTVSKNNYFKALKAWSFDRSRIRFELINAKTVDCLNEGGEQY